MINLLKIILMKFFSMLPDSPFEQYYSQLDMDFFDYLNWFLPLDICIDIFVAWIACIVVYYIFVVIKQIISIVLKGIAQTAAAAKFFV